MVDNQNELITIEALKKAWEKFWKNRDFAVNLFMHSNIPIGKVIPSYTEKDGTVHTSGVDDTGLYIVSKIRTDIKKGREAWDMIERGELRAFSIGGERLTPSERVFTPEGSYDKTTDLELHEISIVDRPANIASTFKILKQDESDFPEKIVLVKDITIDNLIGKPFAGYKDMKECIRRNPQAKDPGAYCAEIHRTATGKYPSQKSEESVSYDLCLLRSIPIHRVSTNEGGDSLVNQSGEASERTATSDEKVGSQIKIKLKGDTKWLEEKKLYQSKAHLKLRKK